MLTSDFDYNLPQNLIAQKPLEKRDDSRMMVVFGKEGKIIHSRFKDLPFYLSQGDILVLNNTRVIPAKAFAKKDGKIIEFLFLHKKENRTWEVLCKPAKKIKPGDVVFFAPGFEGKVLGAEPEGKRIIQFSSRDIFFWLRKIGYAPLPPYIKRKEGNSRLRFFDLERYQTVFAQKQGAIAAPTAGLHFTPEILKEIRKKRVKVSQISLQVGLATFQPVRTERIEDHKMLEETYSISRAVSLAINQAKKESRPVVAVGTTVVRALESAFKDGQVLPGRRSTSLFIRPGYEFKVVDRLLTNFHLPKSTLLMLVSAFVGLDLIKKAYNEAIEKKYRFYSYGDCMLVV